MDFHNEIRDIWFSAQPTMLAAALAYFAPFSEMIIEGRIPVDLKALITVKYINQIL